MDICKHKHNKNRFVWFRKYVPLKAPNGSNRLMVEFVCYRMVLCVN